MKRDRIIYWVSTGLVSLGMAFSCFMYLSKNPELVAGFTALGIPLYFMPLLGITKLLGAIALLVPSLKVLKEWAYAGFTFTFLGATWVHLATNSPFVAPLVFLAVLAVSYWFWKRLEWLKV